LFEVLVDTELLYSYVPLFEVVAICKSSNQFLKTKGPVEVSLLQRVEMIKMLLFSEMKRHKAFQHFDFYHLKQEVTLVAEWTNDGCQTLP
jgi:hypothetical protein